MQKAKSVFFFSLVAVLGLLAWSVGNVWYEHFPTVTSLEGLPFIAKDLPASYVQAINFWSPITWFVWHAGGLAITLFGWFALSLIAEKAMFQKMVMSHHASFLMLGALMTVVLASVVENDMLEGALIICSMLYHVACVVRENYKKEKPLEAAPA